MKRWDFERFVDDWVVPLAVIGLIVWAIVNLV